MTFKNPKILLLTLYFFAVFPLLFVISLLTFYLHTGFFLGHLPIQSMNDPKNYSIYTFYAPIIIWSFEIAFYSFIVWILYINYYFIFKKNEIIKKPILITSLSYLGMVGLFFSEIMVWFCD